MSGGDGGGGGSGERIQKKQTQIVINNSIDSRNKMAKCDEMIAMIAMIASTSIRNYWLKWINRNRQVNVGRRKNLHMHPYFVEVFVQIVLKLNI